LCKLEQIDAKKKQGKVRGVFRKGMGLFETPYLEVSKQKQEGIDNHPHWGATKNDNKERHPHAVGIRQTGLKSYKSSEKKGG